MAGNIALAKAASERTVGIDWLAVAVAFLEFRNIIIAFVFIMALFADGMGRAGFDAGPAGTVMIIQAPFVNIVIRPLIGGEFTIQDNAAPAQRLAYGGDQTVAKAESAQTCYISSMTVRPVGGKPVFFRFLPAETGGSIYHYSGDTCFLLKSG